MKESLVPLLLKHFWVFYLNYYTYNTRFYLNKSHTFFIEKKSLKF